MEEKAIKPDFRHLLQRARRQLVVRLFVFSLRDSLAGASVLLIAGSAVWFALAFFDAGFPSLLHAAELLVLPPLVALFAITACLTWRRWPKLSEVAERLDLKVGSSNTIATAWELLQNNAEDTPFRRFAVERGYVALQNHFSAGPEYDERERRHTLVAVNFFLALFLSLLPFGLSATKDLRGQNVADKSAAVDAINTSADVEPLNLRTNSPTRNSTSVPVPGATDIAAVYRQSATPDHAAASGSDAGQPATAANQQSGTSGSAGATAQSKRPNSRKNVETSRNRERENRSPQSNQSAGQGDSASGSSGMRNSQSGLALQNLSLSGSADNHDASEEDDQADNQGKPSIYSARGGVKPLPPDSGEKPGRELSESDTKGDKPGTGRGGPTGDKKSRGTASLISGVSLPDVVGGKLSKGFDITNLEHIPALREPAETAVLPPPAVSIVADEPVTTLPVTPPELRETVKNYLLKLHHYDNQQQEQKYDTDTHIHN